MLVVSELKVMNFEGALRGARNPMNSWDRADSEYDYTLVNEGDVFADCPMIEMGEKDWKMALNLATAGSDHGKFLRQIFISVDIDAPLYWWKEFDTYKVATVANSCSTMHKLGSRALEYTDFSWDDDNASYNVTGYREDTLNYLNETIEAWKSCEDPVLKKRIWRQLIQDLPSSFMQKRTVTLNYETARNMYFARKSHKLSEWKEDFVHNVLLKLPYPELITTPRTNEEERKLNKMYDALDGFIELFELEFPPLMNAREVASAIRTIMDKHI
jgi:hypothetical protein